MIYRIFIILTVFLAVIYYLSVVLQIFTNNKIKVTRREITLKALIPFYYWIK
jgi:Na+-translocating ferredoxin:NAD+ oxidoreductase RnfG subunit